MLIFISYWIFLDAMESPLHISKISEREYSLKTVLFIYYMKTLLQTQKHQWLRALSLQCLGVYTDHRGIAVNIQTTN